MKLPIQFCAQRAREASGCLFWSAGFSPLHRWPLHPSLQLVRGGTQVRTVKRAKARAPVSGFTLLEIMVAVSLLAVIIIGLLAMFYQVQRAFRAGTAQVDVMEGGRATMSILTRELQEMIPSRVDYTTNFAVVPSENPGLFFVQALPSGQARENYMRDLIFLSKVNDEWVGTAYRLSNAISGVGTLYRLTERWTNNSDPQIDQQICSNLSRFVSTATPYNNRNFHQVVDGIVSLTADAYDRFGHAESNLASRLEGISFGYTNRFLPAYVDLELAVLEPSAVEKFRARAEIDQNRATNYLAQQIGRTHVFRQRVAIKASRAALTEDENGGLIP